ncbi:MAG: beta-glucosidase, partial [Sphingomonas sp.]
MSLDRRALLARAGLLAAAAAVPAPTGAAARRIDDLLARMTIAEKAGQLSCFNDEIRPVGAVFNPVVNRQSADAQLAAIRAGRIGMLFNGYGVAADEADAARQAILAGIDVSMQSGLFNDHLPALVASGAVPIARIDEAVRRVLSLKQALGLFDDPYRSIDPRAERNLL